MEHTKGPWKSFNHYVSTADQQGIANCKNVQEGNPITPAESYANARLIAAAPDLLAACKGILIYAHEIAERADIDDGHAFWAYIADAVDAIAAAEGK